MGEGESEKKISSPSSSSSSADHLIHFLGSDSLLLIQMQNNADDDSYDTRFSVKVEQKSVSSSSSSSSFPTTNHVTLDFDEATPPDCLCDDRVSSCNCRVGNPLAKDDGVIKYVFRVETPAVVAQEMSAPVVVARENLTSIGNEASKASNLSAVGIAPRTFNIVVEKMYLAGDADKLKVRIFLL